MEDLSQIVSRLLSESGHGVAAIKLLAPGVVEASLPSSEVLVITVAQGAFWMKYSGGQVERVELKATEAYGNETTGADQGQILSQVTGKVLLVSVSEGDEVQAGQLIMKIESMKMELEIRAPRTTKISKIIPKAGDSVKYRQVLVSFT